MGIVNQVGIAYWTRDWETDLVPHLGKAVGLGFDFLEVERTAGDTARHVHLGETNGKAPGRGRVPWAESFGTLHALAYRGPSS